MQTLVLKVLFGSKLNSTRMSGIPPKIFRTRIKTNDFHKITNCFKTKF